MLKRVFDFLFAFIFLILFFPFLLLIGIAVILDSKGSIFYFQTRVGKNNHDFKLIKFRTMQPNSDNKGLLTVGFSDSRITRVGYYLRKYKLDELPQFINVLIGNMSIVGPRPEVRKFVDLYTKEQQEILNVKPGITDIASLEYFSENELLAQSKNPEQTYITEIMPHKIALNKKYLARANFSNDMVIIFATVKKILLK